jgi:hypothetical protein
MIAGRPARVVTLAERGQFLLDYIELLQQERIHESAASDVGSALSASDVGSGFSRIAPATSAAVKSHDRWVVNKLRALGSYYTKGVENGSELREALNRAGSVDSLRELIARFFFISEAPRRAE